MLILPARFVHTDEYFVHFERKKYQRKWEPSLFNMWHPYCLYKRALADAVSVMTKKRVRSDSIEYFLVLIAGMFRGISMS